jgi:TP901-1 family phage major tail protein
MATGLVNGTDLLLKVGDTATEDPIAFATSCSLEISMDEIDQTNKDSSGWKTIIGGTRSWSVSADVLYQNEAKSSNYTFLDFWDHLGGANERTALYVELTVTGASAADVNKFYHGQAYITSLSVNGGTEDQATYSVTLTGTGVLTEATSTA